MLIFLRLALVSLRKAIIEQEASNSAAKDVLVDTAASSGSSSPPGLLQQYLSSSPEAAEVFWIWNEQHKVPSSFLCRITHPGILTATPLTLHSHLTALQVARGNRGTGATGCDSDA